MEYIGFIKKDARFGPRGVGALTQLNSICHRDEASALCRWSLWTDAVHYPREEEHGYRFTTAFTFSVRTPK